MRPQAICAQPYAGVHSSYFQQDPRLVQLLFTAREREQKKCRVFIPSVAGVTAGAINSGMSLVYVRSSDQKCKHVAALGQRFQPGRLNRSSIPRYTT